jgi:hypothetical protein
MLRQTVQHRHHGRSQKNQRGSDGHEEQMLDHVDRQQLLIECGKGRADCDPDEEHSEEKATGSPSSNDTH